MEAGAKAGVSLADVLSQRRFHRAGDIHVTSCCTNPSLCREGDLYVATLSSGQDGHEGVSEALSRGVTAVLCERLLPVDVPQCVVPDAKRALAHICQSLAGYPARTLPVVGVAGGGSLTPCQWLFVETLKRAGFAPASFNQLAIDDGLGATPRLHPVTSAAQHAQWLASSLANGCSHAVTELPHRSVADQIYAATQLQILMLPQLRSVSGRDALTAPMKTYFERLLGCLDTDGLLVANVDCAAVAELLRFVERPVLTVSTTQASADLTCTPLESFPSEQTFLLRAGYDTVPVRTKIIGDAHRRACLLATAAGLSQGIELTTIVDAIESVERLPGHLERVECGQPFHVFVDGSPTTTEFQYALATVRRLTKGRVICVFGGGAAAQQKTRWRRGRLAERGSDLPIITSDIAVDGRPLDAAHDVLDGFQRPAKAHLIPNRLQAIEWGLAQCEPGDTLLVAGAHNRSLSASPDDFPSDADTARYWLYEMASHWETDRLSAGR